MNLERFNKKRAQGVKSAIKKTKSKQQVNREKNMRWFKSLSSSKQAVTRLFMTALDGAFDVGGHFHKQAYHKKPLIALLAEHASELEVTNKQIAQVLATSETTVQQSRTNVTYNEPLFTQKYPYETSRNRISEYVLETTRRVMKTIGACSGREYIVRDQIEDEFYQKYVQEFKKQAPSEKEVCKDLFYRMFYGENKYRIQIGTRHNKCPTCREYELKENDGTITEAERKTLKAHKSLLSIQNIAHRRDRERVKS